MNVTTPNQETTELPAIKAEDFNLQEEQGIEVTKGLKTILDERDILEEGYKRIIAAEITPELILEAKEMYTKIRDNRSKGIEPWHKVTKEFSLRYGQFVDAMKNREVLYNKRMEENMLWIAEIPKREEEAKKEKIKAARIDLLSEFTEFDHSMHDLANMKPEVFEKLLSDQQDLKIYKEQKAQKEAEEKAKADEEERLKAEAIEAAKKAKDERIDSLFKAGLKFNGESFIFKNDFGYIDIHHTDILVWTVEEFDTKVQECLNKKIEWEALQVEKDKKDQEEADRLKKENESKTKELQAAEAEAKAAKEKAEAIERELEAKKKAEKDAWEKQKAEVEAKHQAELEAKRKAELAPDKDKLKSFANEVRAIHLKCLPGDLKSEEARKILADALVLINKTAVFIEDKAKTL